MRATLKGKRNNENPLPKKNAKSPLKAEVKAAYKPVKPTKVILHQEPSLSMKRFLKIN